MVNVPRSHGSIVARIGSQDGRDRCLAYSGRVSCERWIARPRPYCTALCWLMPPLSHGFQSGVARVSQSCTSTMGRVRQLHCRDVRLTAWTTATKQRDIERFAWTVHRGSALSVARHDCGDRCRHVCWRCMLRIQSRRLDNTSMHVLSVATALCPPAQLEQGTGSMAAPTARESGGVSISRRAFRIINKCAAHGSMAESTQ